MSDRVEAQRNAAVLTGMERELVRVKLHGSLTLFLTPSPRELFLVAFA